MIARDLTDPETIAQHRLTLASPGNVPPGKREARGLAYREWMRAAVLVLLLGGCSLLVTGPPAAPPAPPDCQRSLFPPIADIGIAFFGLVGTEISAGGGSLGERSNAGLGFFIPLLAVASVSSVYGFVRTGQCRDAYRARATMPIYAPPSAAPPPPFAPPAN